MSVSVGFIPAGLPSTCESTADSHLGVADLTAAISDANEFLGSQRGSQRRQTSGDAGRHQATKSPASWHFRRRQATFSDGTNSPYKRGVTGSNPVLPTKFSQLDGLFGTLAGDPATTAGNHPVHAPCREACPAAMATSPSTAVSAGWRGTQMRWKGRYCAALLPLLSLRWRATGRAAGTTVDGTGPTRHERRVGYTSDGSLGIRSMARSVVGGFPNRRWCSGRTEGLYPTRCPTWAASRATWRRGRGPWDGSPGSHRPGLSGPGLVAAAGSGLRSAGG